MYKLRHYVSTAKVFISLIGLDFGDICSRSIRLTYYTLRGSSGKGVLTC